MPLRGPNRCGNTHSRRRRRIPRRGRLPASQRGRGDEEEIDGDILFQSLPQLAGFLVDVDIFTLTGSAYAAAEDSGDTAGDSAGPNT